MSNVYLAVAMFFCHTVVTITRALLCLGNWSHLGLVNSDDVHKVSLLDDVGPMDRSSEPTEVELPDGWDTIDG